MDGEIELPPFLCDAVEHRLHLAGGPHIERHEYRCLELAGKRLDIRLRLVVEIGHREFRAERAKGLGASPRDRLLVGNANDKATLALEERCFCNWNGHAILSFECGR